MRNYRSIGVNARTRFYAILAAAGLAPEEADELMCAIEAGSVAGAHSGVEEQFAMAPEVRGEVYGEGWDDGVTAVTGDLVAIADGLYRQRGRALSTRALMTFAEVVHDRCQGAEHRGEARWGGDAR
ncbi:hypothetical protein [Streptomyces violascens]|uniref:hypothetical protein n=1 Tax=Streptomyces violascens TaxID=67381 RepID=UPI00366814B2